RDFVVIEPELDLTRELGAADPVETRKEDRRDGELSAGQRRDPIRGRLRDAGDEGVADGRRQFQPAQPAEEVAVRVVGAEPGDLPARFLHLAADAESGGLEGSLAHVDANGGDGRLAERLEADAHAGK